MKITSTKILGIPFVTLCLIWFSVNGEINSLENAVDKRYYGIRMLRMGKKSNDRIARSAPNYNLNMHSIPSSPKLDNSDLEDLYKTYVHYKRDYFPQVGELTVPLSNVGVEEQEMNERSLEKSLYNDEIKRAMGMLRMGKKNVYNEDEKRAMGMLRMGKRQFNSKEEKRAMGMLRMGKKDFEENEKRAMGMLRMGKRGSDESNKRGMGMLRMGKREMDTEEEKRAMGMLRMGKREPETDEEKRAMNMLRMGR